ncbi:MAG: copper resistance CopC family protein [Panacagrimonas sp.]
MAFWLLIACSLGAYGSAVFAHAGLVSSEPGRRAVLAAAPKEIRLCFNENVEAKFSKVSLYNADGTEIPLGELKADPQKPACLTASVDSLPGGSYTIKYRVLSVDGHVVDYGYGFKLSLP